MIDKLKNMKKTDFLVLALVGILLLILAIPTNTGKVSKEEMHLFDTAENLGQNENDTNLENRLCDLLSCMNGVGEVKVMITCLDESQNDYFSVKDTCQVTGVVVVAQGGDNPVVCEEILRVVMSLFPIDAHKITIVKMKMAEV